MDEHVPNPRPLEDWTPEDHMKFRMFSSYCPMCKYKLEYGVLQNLIQSANETDDESTQASLIQVISEKQNLLLEVGLFIANSVDEANRQAGAAHLN